MKNSKTQLVLIIVLLGITNLFSQEKVIVTEADFEKEVKKNTYMPLANSSKKIAWKNTYYVEKFGELETFKGKEYTLCAQKWESGREKKIYFREQSGEVFQYEACCDTETIRFDKKFKKGHTWKSADGKIKYILVTYLGRLKTPYKNYNNLLVIRKLYGRSIYDYYYKKGFGYLGATRNGSLMSYVIPVTKIEKE